MRNVCTPQIWRLDNLRSAQSTSAKHHDDRPDLAHHQSHSSHSSHSRSYTRMNHLSKIPLRISIGRLKKSTLKTTLQPNAPHLDYLGTAYLSLSNPKHPHPGLFQHTPSAGLKRARPGAKYTLFISPPSKSRPSRRRRYQSYLVTGYAHSPISPLIPVLER